MRISIDFCGLQRLNVLASVAILGVSGCGSGSGQDALENNHTGETHYPSDSTGFVYVTSAGPTPDSAGAVYEYSVSGDGTLSPLSQPSIAAGINPSALVVVGNGEYVYVVNAGDGTISQYAVATDATLTPLSPATVTNPGMHTLGTTGGAATTDPLNQYLYVVNTADDDISQFSIGLDGRLTPLATATVATGIAPVSVVTPQSVNAAAENAYYVLNSGATGDAGSVSQYTQAADGTLTLTSAAPLPAGTNPSVISIGASATFVYVFSNCDGTQCLSSIRQFSVGTNGVLTDSGNVVSTGSHTVGVGMAFASDVDMVTGYVLSNATSVNTTSGALSTYQVGSSGDLVATSSPSQSTAGRAVALSETGKVGTLYVLTSNTGPVAGMPATGGAVYLFAGLNGGAPTPLGTTMISAPYPTALGAWVLLEP